MQEFLELLAFALMMAGQLLAVIAGRAWHAGTRPVAQSSDQAHVAGMSEAQPAALAAG